jgi:hypothetical protein
METATTLLVPEIPSPPFTCSPVSAVFRFARRNPKECSTNGSRFPGPDYLTTTPSFHTPDSMSVAYTASFVNCTPHT